MERKPNLTLVTQPHEYFRDLVTQATTRQSVEILPQTEFYLVNLLDQFMMADRLFPQGPLALMFKEAVEEPVSGLQQKLFRKVGDVSLYMAGFFQDSLSRKLVDVDYYIGMGGSAYAQVAARVEEESSREIYEELAQKFGVLVDVLAVVSEETQQKTEKNLLRLYETWLKTRSERAARALQEAGILPNETLKKDLQ